MKVMMASGGTGGHVFPALAVAAELRRRDASCEVLFVGTENGVEARAVPAAGFPLRTVAAAGVQRVSGGGQPRRPAPFSSSVPAPHPEGGGVYSYLGSGKEGGGEERR